MKKLLLIFVIFLNSCAVPPSKVEVIEKYKNVPNDFKSEAVDLMFKDYGFTDSRDLDWLYDDAIDHLFYNSTRRIKNLAKRLGYEEVPCETCREIIKNWRK